MRVHDLKCWPEFFDKVMSGEKTFELRQNDRDFKVGDFLLLREWNPRTGQYTGRSSDEIYITYVLAGGNPCAASPVALKEDYCILGLEPFAEQSRWQRAIYQLCVKETNDSIDGGGCDSGDPLDFSLAEIGQAINLAKGEASR